MVKILDGRKLSLKIGARLRQQISKLSHKPKLLIIQVGDRVESNVYIQKKKDFGELIGADVLHKRYKINIEENELIKQIKKFNSDKSIDGIIVQLPLPKHLDKTKIIEEIDSKKDVDGQTSYSLKSLIDGGKGFVPATTKGIITLLEKNNIAIAKRHVVIVGRSSLVGKPTALEFLKKDATVTVCHSRTFNLSKHTKSADILIAAIGKPHFINKKYVKRGQIIIDVGINQITNSGQTKLVGDVDFNSVKNIVKGISPVPGGVGPMTVLSLFQNLLSTNS